MIFNSETRAMVKEVEKHWKSNLIIRCFILALDIMDCLIFGLVDLNSSWMLTWVWIAIVPSAIWTLVVIIFRLVKIKPIHPGVLVGFEVTIFLASMIIQIMAYIQFIPTSGWEVEWFLEYNTGIFVAKVFACIGLTVINVLHFYLFIRACIETSRARTNEIATQAATMAAQIVKNMESRGTFYRRGSNASYELRPFSVTSTRDLNAEEEGIRPRGGGGGGSGSGSGPSGNNHSHIILGLEDLHHDRRSEFHHTGLAPMNFPAQSVHSGRTGRTMFSQARTAYSHTRSLSVPVPTSPMSLRTARTDEPSLFRLDRY